MLRKPKRVSTLKRVFLCRIVLILMNISIPVRLSLRYPRRFLVVAMVTGGLGRIQGPAYGRQGLGAVAAGGALVRVAAAAAAAL